MKDKHIGLALGGGAVLGAAHIGVLRALREFDISIDCISGTSIGALVSALYAFGNDCEEVQDFVIDLSWGDVASFSPSKFGLFSNTKIGDFLEKQIGDVTFDMSKIPLAVIATDIGTGKKVVLKEGSICDAVIASSCIPGVFQPVKINDQLLVDGGLVENVPISPLRALGADYIIAVDLNAKHEYGEPKNMIDVLLNSFHYTMANVSNLQTLEADLLIQPDLSSFNRIDANQTEGLIESGYVETKRILEQLD